MPFFYEYSEIKYAFFNIKLFNYYNNIIIFKYAECCISKLKAHYFAINSNTIF